ncbi:uncharacterized protein BO87DRAFT_53444 [Aspergillus neoniger CBS 115656]|uniref:Uncharacterized protein n=1 Tax=Aspergillus neoniger (strain CBS 115656) TaxID=1448310 RepID=A0A318YPZ3_ASPNB|nr:hypothetical protein BO87DRAFT_53444 [Aspergillus neoniger CBS 115656]PYH34150.1 hypothetical protein BO87DRAFT_53444 [Aspergillus neoniger CBS 115656]
MKLTKIHDSEISIVMSVVILPSRHDIRTEYIASCSMSNAVLREAEDGGRVDPSASSCWESWDNPESKNVRWSPPAAAEGSRRCRRSQRGERLLTRLMHPCRPAGRVGALRDEAESLEHPFESLELPQGINHGRVIVFWGPIGGRWKNDHHAEQLIGHPELHRCPQAKWHLHDFSPLLHHRDGERARPAADSMRSDDVYRG